MKISNEFCEMDVDLEPWFWPHRSSNYGKWGYWRAGIQWAFDEAREHTGIEWLQYPEVERYKAGYIIKNRQLIKQIAAQNHIPAYLLAGIAYAEATGKPDYSKPLVWQGRMMAQRYPSLRRMRGLNILPENTSMGILAMQIGTAARQIDKAGMIRSSGSWWDRAKAYARQAEIGACLLESDRFNLQAVARHLRSLILYDYPDADTEHLTDEQVILVGSRYNRGTERAKEDFIRSIHTAPTTDKSDPNYKVRDWTSYGRALLEHKAHVEALLAGGKR